MTEQSEDKTPYHHGDLRRVIIDTALLMLGESNGWQFTLREVARRAAVSHTAPYRHFADKNALLAELALIGFDKLGTKLSNAIQPLTGSPKEQLIVAAKAYISFGLTHASHYKLMFSSEAGTADTVHLNERSLATLGVLIDILKDGQKVGVFKNQSIDGQAAACWAQVHGLTMLSIDGLLLPEKVGPNAIELALTTLLEGLSN